MLTPEKPEINKQDLQPKDLEMITERINSTNLTNFKIENYIVGTFRLNLEVQDLSLQLEAANLVEAINGSFLSLEIKLPQGVKKSFNLADSNSDSLARLAKSVMYRFEMLEADALEQSLWIIKRAFYLKEEKIKGDSFISNVAIKQDSLDPSKLEIHLVIDIPALSHYSGYLCCEDNLHPSVRKHILPIHKYNPEPSSYDNDYISIKLKLTREKDITDHLQRFKYSATPYIELARIANTVKSDDAFEALFNALLLRQSDLDGTKIGLDQYVNETRRLFPPSEQTRALIKGKEEISADIVKLLCCATPLDPLQIVESNKILYAVSNDFAPGMIAQVFQVGEIQTVKDEKNSDEDMVLQHLPRWLGDKRITQFFCPLGVQGYFQINFHPQLVVRSRGSVTGISSNESLLVNKPDIGVTEAKFELGDFSWGYNDYYIASSSDLADIVNTRGKPKRLEITEQIKLDPISGLTANIVNKARFQLPLAVNVPDSLWNNIAILENTIKGLSPGDYLAFQLECLSRTSCSYILNAV